MNDNEGKRDVCVPSICRSKIFSTAFPALEIFPFFIKSLRHVFNFSLPLELSFPKNEVTSSIKSSFFSAVKSIWKILSEAI